MIISKPQFSSYIKNFELSELFIDLGWNADKYTQSLTVNGNTYTLKSAAEKSGFKIMICPPSDKNIFPDKAERQKINNQFTKLKSKHVIIFIDEKKTRQIWQIALKLPGKPKRFYEISYNISQDPEILYQKTSGLFFELKDEDNITIIDVLQKINQNFSKNAETVTKKFYDGFKAQHKKFYGFIKGIDDIIDNANRKSKNPTENKNKLWYVSLMLNRLMFCYFIQKQRFLNNDVNYLRNKLNESILKRGNNEFYSFYKDFLLVLFHDALNSPIQTEEIKKEFGRIPYLNGGLFDVHQLEKDYGEISIDDKAFEAIFDFFDEWNWHLDTKITATGKDINPDVIGYIFEKYINDRAAMGAYYTKEDITGYISKNTIIPYIFDEVSRLLKKDLFEDGSEINEMINNSGDLYIYNSVKKGIRILNDEINELEDIQDFSEFPIRNLPKAIEKGISKVSERTDWNKPASEEYVLPTEIWRETIDRRNKYFEVFEKIKSGKVSGINDFITYNLNIVQFIQDVIDKTEDTKLIEIFYKVLCKVTILDPTCGSGAFLFAAMNILEPLYESCINRMEEFISGNPKSKFVNFNKWLEIIKAPEHPNLRYFIYKTIILNNLYGVDIMREAVEIAKLRLFLKLVATVEPDYKKNNLGLEPLPDIDFNIRAGNTLVGFVSEKELEDSFPLDFDNEKGKILEEMKTISDIYKRFKEAQLESPGLDSNSDLKKAKETINNRLKTLNEKLNALLSKSFGVDSKKESKYEAWKESHQPFHWIAEFYEIVYEHNGFDVIIGNPPYIEYKKVKNTYEIINYISEKCGNLYGFVFERSILLSNEKSFIGMIIPMSSICTDRASDIQNFFKNRNTYLSNFSGDRNPAEMFDGVKMRLTIVITFNNLKNKNYTTNYIKWYTAYREFLMHNISYKITEGSKINTIPKLNNNLATSIYAKINKATKLNAYLNQRDTGYYFHNAPIHWVRAFNFIPFFRSERDGEMISSHYKSFSGFSPKKSKALLAILNSTLFYFWFVINSNARDLSVREIYNFGLNLNNEVLTDELSEISSKLMNYYKKISKIIDVVYKSSGNVQYQQIDTKKAKFIIDQIDRALGKSLGLKDDEIDYIINFDIKFRMGKESEE